MTLTQIVILAIIQGLAELLPVSSSAHVIAAARLMHLQSNTADFHLLILMLHTGTMFAVIVYFWRAWNRAFFSSRENFLRFANRVIIATLVTGALGIVLKYLIEHWLRRTHPGKDAEIEELFSHLEVLAGALAAVGLLILWSGFAWRRRGGRDRIGLADSIAIGGIQGLCLPFRGFSRSGATISVGLLRGINRARLEEYSFALAVVLTPPLLYREVTRFIHARGGSGSAPIGMSDFLPSLIGMVLSFMAGLAALRLLSRVLEKGQWWAFGIYCLLASAGVFVMYLKGY